ncbi:Cytochrome b5 isoform A [Eumeta japonica]|uniref:Cytochrome b5 isoform A n=1 Tax=Eumeta variegata TaxID=151549 RepID=A0A4C1XI73_EUMVA|nr:Cytochrome b5 isoform A [Eumeta japonica]
MAQVQNPPEITLQAPLTPQEQPDLFSLTMAALRLISPWAVSPQDDWERAESPTPEDPKDRTITLSEVACHDSPDDCWVVIYDRVYDITTFLDEHPGGADIMLEYAGQDASTAFRGSGHSKAAVRALDRFPAAACRKCPRRYPIPSRYRKSHVLNAKSLTL